MRILGLDIGTSSVKAVEVESAFGRYEIHEYHEQKVLAGSDPVDVARALINGLAKRPDRIGVALRSSQVTFRNLAFPTRDKKAIQTGISFELDDELPFAVEDAAYDWFISPVAGSPGSQVHVAATLKRYLSALLDRFQAVEIDPDLVTSEAWAYRTYLNRITPPEEQKSATMVVQIGQQNTTIYVHHRGLPVVAREIPWGGKDITDAISRRYGVAEAQAETAKLEHGFVLSDSQQDQATAEQIEFSNAILEEVSRLTHEIRQAEFTTKNSNKVGIHRIYLSGGTSLLPGLVRRVEEELKIPTQLLRALSSVATSGVNYSDQTDATFLPAVAIALTQVGPDRSASVNFRRRFFQKQGKTPELQLSALKGPLLAAAAVFACLIASVSVQTYFHQRQLTQIDEQLERSVRSFFGQLSASAARSQLANPAQLSIRIESELKKQRAAAKLAGPNERSPLEFLRNLSQAVPSDLKLDLIRYSVGASPAKSFAESDAQDISVTFWLTSQDSANRLAELLGSRISGMKTEGPAQVAAPNGSPRWRVTYTGTPSEAAYGN